MRSITMHQIWLFGVHTCIYKMKKELNHLHRSISHKTLEEITVRIHHENKHMAICTDWVPGFS